MRRYWFTTFLALLGLVMLLFLTVPLFKMLIGNDVKTLLKTIQEADVAASVWLTMKVSFFSTLFALFTGLPLAYLIARHTFFGRSFLETLIDIPIMIPHTAAGIALLVAFGSGLWGDFFNALGIHFIGTETGIMIAMMFLSSTFLINGAKEGFKKVDVKLEKVARTLGATPLKVFFAISLPNAKKDIVNGCLMMWGRGLGEFGAVVILVYHPMTAPVLIYDRFTSFGLSYSAPVAGVMIILSILVFLSVRFVNNRLR
ncbi:ABC transporter permease [Sulfurospirillum sp. MES]|jgi:molybdate/tungstate transport system permease protein|uniref:ABC transporter permease n=1 Tax=Sulfurospirillum TaxID=57665 RepID=UPI0005419D26|nr:ABC transporter permease [Sulfurospirillum sp. MES]KHG33519.1 MAG: molybdenum ABC transporter permease [Sulfurospirillum sp. MES]